MRVDFDTTIKAERVKVLKRLAKKAGLTRGWSQVNTDSETIMTDSGVYYLDMAEQGTYSAECRICDHDTGKPLLERVI